MSETTKRCQVEMSDDKPCGRELYDGQCCIFHSKKENKDVEQFQNQFNEIFKTVPPKHYDFTSFIFPERIVFPKKFPVSVFLAGAVFKGRVDFRSALFEGEAIFVGAIFMGEVDFQNAIFKGDAYFSMAGFTADANFESVAFQGNAYFAEAFFEGEAKFSNCVFKRNGSFSAVDFHRVAKFSKAIFEVGAQFMETVFRGEADFEGATFSGEAELFHAAFKGKSYFYFATFNGNALFDGAVFEDFATFESVQFKGDAGFWGHAFQELGRFDSATFEGILRMDSQFKSRKDLKGKVEFRNVKLLKPEKVEFIKADLSGFRFLETDLRGVHFIDEQWDEGKGRKRVYDEISPDPYWKNFDYPLIAQLYRRLRANYEDNLRYSEAGDFYIGEMEMTRKAEKGFFKRLSFSVYKVFSNYGESYYRPLRWWILPILVIFPFVFMFFGIESVSLYSGDITRDVIDYTWDFSSMKSIIPTSEKITDYWSSFLYSLSVFSFIGDKKYTTIDIWGDTLFVLESILSPVTLAFFLLALRRRFKR